MASPHRPTEQDSSEWAPGEAMKRETIAWRQREHSWWPQGSASMSTEGERVLLSSHTPHATQSAPSEEDSCSSSESERLPEMARSPFQLGIGEGSGEQEEEEKDEEEKESLLEVSVTEQLA